MMQASAEQLGLSDHSADELALSDDSDDPEHRVERKPLARSQDVSAPVEEPPLSSDIQKQRNYLLLALALVVVFTLWKTQMSQGPMKWNIDCVLGQELACRFLVLATR